MDDDHDDDVPALSASTFAALQEFYSEQETREASRITAAAAGESLHEDSGDHVEEDWQLSQFWYEEATAEALAGECRRLAEEKKKNSTGEEPFRIACISCPTLFLALRKGEAPAGDLISVKLFEIDTRFARFGGDDFIAYDYRSPLDVPRDLRENFDLVVADPPFLSEECLTKTAVTVKFLAKEKIILCTGAVMEELAGRLLSLKKCEFRPRHKNNLANEFICLCSYDLNSYLTNS